MLVSAGDHEDNEYFHVKKYLEKICIFVFHISNPGYQRQTCCIFVVLIDKLLLI